MNSTPLRWSISCWMQVANSPSASTSCALPSISRYLHPHLGRPLDVLVIFRDGEAAFLVQVHLFRRPGDLRIDEHLRRFLVVLFREVHGHEAQRLADLDRRQPDAGRVIHRLEHVIGERANGGVHRRHRFGDEAELLVGQDEDVAQGHARDVIIATGAVNSSSRAAHAPVPPRASFPLPRHALATPLPVRMGRWWRGSKNRAG